MHRRAGRPRAHHRRAGRFRAGRLHDCLQSVASTGRKRQYGPPRRLARARGPWPPGAGELKPGRPGAGRSRRRGRRRRVGVTGRGARGAVTGPAAGLAARREREQIVLLRRGGVRRVAELVTRRGLVRRDGRATGTARHDRFVRGEGIRPEVPVVVRPGARGEVRPGGGGDVWPGGGGRAGRVRFHRLGDGLVAELVSGTARCIRAACAIRTARHIGPARSVGAPRRVRRTRYSGPGRHVRVAVRGSGRPAVIRGLPAVTRGVLAVIGWNLLVTGGPVSTVSGPGGIPVPGSIAVQAAARVARRRARRPGGRTVVPGRGWKQRGRIARGGEEGGAASSAYG